jgi:hypothetical protein
MDLEDVFQSTLVMQAGVNFMPGTWNIPGNFARSVIGSPARTVEQLFGAVGQGTNAPGIADHALTTPLAHFLVHPELSVHADTVSVDGRIDRDVLITFGYELNPGRTGHGDETVVGGDKLIQVREKYSVAGPFQGILGQTFGLAHTFEVPVQLSV